MTHVLCAKISDFKKTSNCFAKKKKIKNFRIEIGNLENLQNNQFNDIDFNEKYKFISEMKLASGFVVPIDTIVLAWDSHTFGLIKEKNEIPIKIPTFNSKDEFIYDTFISVPISYLSS